jgi:flagellar basal body-associated protein FliL
MMLLRLLRLTFALVLVLSPAAHAGGGGGGHGGAKSSGKSGESGHGAKAPKKQRPITSLASWVMVDPFTVTVIQEDIIRGKMSVSFGMDVPDEALRTKAEEWMPRLQDAWLTHLNRYAATALKPHRSADIPAIANLLQATADRVLGKPGSKVLLASVIIRME